MEGFIRRGILTTGYRVQCGEEKRRKEAKVIEKDIQEVRKRPVTGALKTTVAIGTCLSVEHHV